MAEARRHGLTAPGFSSPPRRAGADRTIRRIPGGGVLVAVRVRGRRPDEVAADMVEGVVAANQLDGAAAAGWRAALLAAIYGGPVDLQAPARAA
jgi:hypothetical protein